MNILYLFIVIMMTLIFVFGGRFLLHREQLAKIYLLKQWQDDFNKATSEFADFLLPSSYICDTRYQQWRIKYHYLSEKLPAFLWKIKTRDQFVELLRLFFQQFFNGRDFFIDPHNEDFVKSESPIIKHVLGEKKIKYNDDQVNAIASDEDNTLLVAGAGTGKTTTILGKLAYLLERVGVSAEEILVLSFTGRAVDELAARIKNKFNGIHLEPRTFHSFGLSIIGQVRGKKPDLAFGDNNSKKRFLSAQFDGLLNEPDYAKLALEYFAYYLQPQSLKPEFNNLDEYYQYCKNVGFLTLKNEKVKSHQEMMLANFLFLNSLNYVYEAPYKHESATNIFRQYKPDFYLPDYDVYIEHFGIDAHGMVYFTQDEDQNHRESIKYRADMEWKRGLHKKYLSTLIETYSYEFSAGDWKTKLLAKLSQHNITVRQLSADDIQTVLQKSDDIKKIIELFDTFLGLCKSNCLGAEQLREKVSQRANAREQAFFDIFAPLYLAYENYLRQTGEIDFHDMLLEAALYISEGRYLSCFKYIIIDEFQDFSVSKSKLVKALCDQNSDTKLFCVGDDWQSIFRFAGSDVSLMTNFEDVYGFTRQNRLVVTNRFNDRLAVISNQFILRNPSQIHKEVHSEKKVDYEPLEIIHERRKNEEDHFLREILTLLNKGEKSTVFLLGRYKHSAPVNLWQYRKEYQNLSIEFLTIHAAKGSEADYVIILDVCSGKFGFPSEISDDPLLNIVLSRREQYPNAEERRLMYVAMTRARKKIYILTVDGMESVFVLELERADAKKEKIVCRACGGQMKKINGPYGVFYGCSNFPQCDYKFNVKRNYLME